MKSDELRIGNWIEFKNPVGSKYVKVMGMQINKLSIVYDYKEFKDISSNSFSPISLTEDIFLKCGFTKQIGYCFRFKNVHITESCIEIGWNDNKDNKPQYYVYLRNFNTDKSLPGGVRLPDDLVIVRNDLMYLHELQNLFFFITGNELSISL